MIEQCLLKCDDACFLLLKVLSYHLLGLRADARGFLLDRRVDA